MLCRCQEFFRAFLHPCRSRDVAAKGFERARGIRVSANFERVFALQLEQCRNFFQNSRDLAFWSF